MKKNSVCILFVVSRDFQVEYQFDFFEKHLKQKGYQLCFLDVSSWTGGNAGNVISSLGLDNRSIRIPRALGKEPYFGSVLGYVELALSARKIYSKLKSIIKLVGHVDEMIVWSEQIYNPLELTILSLMPHPNLKRVYYQHGFDSFNKYESAGGGKVLGRIKDFVMLLQYYVLGMLFKRRLLPSMQKLTEIYLVYNKTYAEKLERILGKLPRVVCVGNLFLQLRKRSKLKYAESYHAGEDCRRREVLLTSAGVFRYKNKAWLNEQEDIFSQLLSMITAQGFKNITLRFKPGEESGFCRTALYKKISASAELSGIVSFDFGAQPFSLVVKSCAVIICPSVSTVWVESLLLGKPFLVYEFNGILSNYNYYADTLKSSGGYSQVHFDDDNFKVCFSEGYKNIRGELLDTLQDGLGLREPSQEQMQCFP